MILRRYIIRSLAGPFLLGFGIVTFLLTMDMLLDLLDLLISKGIAVWTVTRLFLLALGWMVALSIPCGVLVAALMAFGRLSQDNEIIALRASGVHLLRILLPALVLSVIVAGGLTLFNNYILPETNYAYASLMQEISRARPTAEIREGVLISDFQGYDLLIGRLDDQTGRMEDVLILDGKTRPEAPRTILAESGTLEFRPEKGTLTLVLHDGEIHEADPNSRAGEYRRLKFETQTLNITDAGDSWRNTIRHTRSQREMSVEAMGQEIARLHGERTRQDSLLQVALAAIPVASVDELNDLDPSHARPGFKEVVFGLFANLVSGKTEKEPRSDAPGLRPEIRHAVEVARSRLREREVILRRINEYQVEIHKKFSIPVACIVFVLVGAPLGILARRGGLAAGFFSAAFFVFYYLFLIGGEQLADRLLLPPWLAMWLPNFILGGLGIYLTARAVVSGQPARPRSREARR